MSILLGIAIGVLVIALLALFFVISFSKKKMPHSFSRSLNKKDHTLFFSWLETLSIKHPLIVQLYTKLHEQIVGMDWFLHGLLLALLAWGHVLVEWAPGLAKTKTIRLVASLLALDTKRVQFTPDMLPADLIGVDMFNSATRQFETFFWPLFTNILLADEINRATPKVQSALLEAMQEQQVSIGGKSYPLNRPFFVLATQNPIEQDGTYLLPEAQLDRFMMKLSVDYPSLVDEKKILQIADRTFNNLPDSVINSEELIEIQMEVSRVVVSDQLLQYIADIVTATRAENSDIAYWASPRWSLAILSLARAIAFLEWRSSVEKSDIQRVILPALSHRIVLSMRAQMDQKKPETILFQALADIL